MGFPILSTGMPSRFARQDETRLDCMHERVLTGELNLADESGQGTEWRRWGARPGGGEEGRLIATGIDGLGSRHGARWGKA